MVFVKTIGLEVADIIGSFLSTNMRESGAEGVVIGLSGGIDSALCAKLCSDALEPEKVNLFFMPEEATPEGDHEDVKRISEHLGIPLNTLPINGIVDVFKGHLSGYDAGRDPGDDNLQRAHINIKPRIRAAVLFYYANLLDCLVIGPSNKSELLTGYFTKFGDGASDLAPIGDLYKTQVFMLARALGFPSWLIEKRPSPGLDPGVSDEDELEISYELLDQILAGLDFGYGADYVAEKIGVPLDEVERVQGMVDSTIHKRRFPRIPKIGLYTVGVDRKEF